MKAERPVFCFDLSIIIKLSERFPLKEEKPRAVHLRRCLLCCLTVMVVFEQLETVSFVSRTNVDEDHLSLCC